MPFNKPRVNLPRYHLISPPPQGCDAGALPPDCHPAPTVTGGTRTGLLSHGFLQQIYRATSAALHCGAFQPAASFSISLPAAYSSRSFIALIIQSSLGCVKRSRPSKQGTHKVSLRGGQFLSAEAVSSPIAPLSLLLFYYSIMTVHIPSIVGY